MAKEVTFQNLNRAFMNELFSSVICWVGLVIYVLGVFLYFNGFVLAAGIVMFIGAFMMLSADLKGQRKVLKRLQWKR